MASNTKSDPQSKSSNTQPIAMPASPLGKSFEPQAFEAQIYEYWEKNGCFKASDENAPGQDAFSIVIPPPNVTGVLHMGHALTNTIQDILVRWRRMKGDNTLWLPGTDHAGIATQAQVEKAIRPKSRYDLGREKFVERTWEWKEEQGNKIGIQLKRLGSSLDWERSRFTMDEGFSKAVREVFVRLYEQDLIYRGTKIINWCLRCQTALSDLEVIPTERKGNLWHLVYEIVDSQNVPVKNSDGSDARLVIATTRPETLLGDSAVAVHPEDERYKQWVGLRARVPLAGRTVPVIADAYVDKEFGSGALKVTPAHDFNDCDLGQKHSLETICVMGKDGKISQEGGSYAGLKFAEARTKILEDLAAAGLLVKTEEHTHKVGLCQRCETVVEPIISKQWFVKIAPLAEPAIEAVETGKIVFSPPSWEKVYFEWMHNIRDWCISRQLWWGHQIPAWYCKKCEDVTVARTTPTECSHCKASNESKTQLVQDEDVLDTWFSSALWPFATMGWPQNTKPLKTFYPTSILETGFDIIFFWVARMIMMGIHFMGEVPFHKVYLHAMVRDEKGEKMSKSKGNVIDPLVLMDAHGADPLRFTLAIMAGQGRDIKLSADRVEGYRAFCNKLWNAVKFFHLQLEPEQGGLIEEPEGGVQDWLVENRIQLSPVNRWILSRLQGLIPAVNSGLENFELNLSAQALYEFTWHELCDWYIEFSKLALRGGGEQRVQTLYTLRLVLGKVLRLLHPFMPFVTEQLWQSLPWKESSTTTARQNADLPEMVSIMLRPYPKGLPVFKDVDSENTVMALKSIVEAVRNFRGENGIAPKVEFSLGYLPKTSAGDAFMKLHGTELKFLARLGEITKVATPKEEGASGGREAVIVIPFPPMELRIPLKGLVNVEEETRRIQKEIEKLDGDLAHVRNKLSQETFIARAPVNLVEKERAREKALVTQRAQLEQALQRLQQV